jgi:hypothetical protein
MGIPMLASGISTVLTTTPLFATKTLILKNFASVIAVTMSVGLLYTFIFLVPLMGLCGPKQGHTRQSDEGGFTKRVLATMYLSKAVRFIVVCALLALALVRTLSCPAAFLKLTIRTACSLGDDCHTSDTATCF